MSMVMAAMSFKTKDVISVLRVTVSYYAERLAGNVDGFVNIRIGESGVNEVVVVVREEYSAANAFRYPLLMEHEVVVVRNAQVEQRRNSADVKVEAVVRSSFDKLFFQASTLVDEYLRTVETLHFLNAGNSGGKWNS